MGREAVCLRTDRPLFNGNHSPRALTKLLQSQRACIDISPIPSPLSLSTPSRLHDPSGDPTASLPHFLGGVSRVLLLAVRASEEFMFG